MSTVLLVDPSAFTRKQLQRELEARGYRVIADARGLEVVVQHFQQRAERP